MEEDEYQRYLGSSFLLPGADKGAKGKEMARSRLLAREDDVQLIIGLGTNQQPGWKSTHVL